MNNKLVKIAIGLLIIDIIITIFATMTRAQVVEYSFDTLVTPGATVAVNIPDCLYHTYQYVLTGVSNNVVVKFEGSLDNTNWFNLDDEEATTTKSANGIYKAHKPTFVTKYTRFNWVSKNPVGVAEVTPNIAIKYIGSR